VVELDDTHARILAQTLNRTWGKDDPLAYRRVLEELLMSATPAEAAEFLPESSSVAMIPARVGVASSSSVATLSYSPSCSS
jgi:hypothetical protein